MSNESYFNPWGYWDLPGGSIPGPAVSVLIPLYEQEIKDAYAPIGTNTMPVSTTPTVSQQELQSAAVALTQASGSPTSCANYVTSNQGGVLVNDLCTVAGSSDFHDASLSNQMTQQQLQDVLAFQQAEAQRLAQQGIQVNPDPSWMINNADTTVVGTPVTTTTTVQATGNNGSQNVLSSSQQVQQQASVTANAQNLLNTVQAALSQNSTFQSMQQMLSGETQVGDYKVPHIWAIGAGAAVLLLWMMKGK